MDQDMQESWAVHGVYPNMAFTPDQKVQRDHSFAIVDEVDSILIDEARTPLIISGPTNVSVDKYYTIDAVIPMLQNEIDYVIDEKGRAVHLSDQGVDKVEGKLGIHNLYDPQHMEILHHVNQVVEGIFVEGAVENDTNQRGLRVGPRQCGFGDNCFNKV